MSDQHIAIIAPHPDDEIIGCFEVISNYKTMILYDASTPQLRREEAMKLKDEFDIVAQVFMTNLPPPWMSMKNIIFFFPDPTYETHPLHRQWGIAGEMMARAGQKVIFYNTIMNAPYIHEVDCFHAKRDTLDKYFPSQKNMWTWEHKYYLFEGYKSYIFNVEDILHNEKDTKDRTCGSDVGCACGDGNPSAVG